MSLWCELPSTDTPVHVDRHPTYLSSVSLSGHWGLCSLCVGIALQGRFGAFMSFILLPQIPARVVSIYPRDQLPLCGEDPEPLARESVMPAILLASKPIISRQEGLSELPTNLSPRPGSGSEPKAATTCFCCCLRFCIKMMLAVYHFFVYVTSELQFC